jgi:hypothetical protein
MAGVGAESEIACLMAGARAEGELTCLMAGVRMSVRAERELGERMAGVRMKIKELVCLILCAGLPSFIRIIAGMLMV